MNEQTVLPAHLQRYLPHRLKKRLRFYIAYGAAYLGYNNIGIRLLSYPVYKFLYLVCNMRYHLYGGAQIFPPALLVKHIPVYLSRCKV